MVAVTRNPLVTFVALVAVWPWPALLPRSDRAFRTHSGASDASISRPDSVGLMTASLPGERKPAVKGERRDGSAPAMALTAWHPPVAARGRVAPNPRLAPVFFVRPLDCASLCRFLV